MHTIGRPRTTDSRPTRDANRDQLWAVVLSSRKLRVARSVIRVMTAIVKTGWLVSILSTSRIGKTARPTSQLRGAFKRIPASSTVVSPIREARRRYQIVQCADHRRGTRHPQEQSGLALQPKIVLQQVASLLGVHQRPENPGWRDGDEDRECPPTSGGGYDDIETRSVRSRARSCALCWGKSVDHGGHWNEENSVLSSAACRDPTGESVTVRSPRSRGSRGSQPPVRRCTD